MTSIVITPFEPEHTEELKGFIHNELDNADFDGEDMPSCIEVIDVRRLQQINALFRDAFQRIADTLRDHPDADKGMTRVHYALMQAKNALNNATQETT